MGFLCNLILKVFIKLFFLGDLRVYVTLLLLFDINTAAVRLIIGLGANTSLILEVPEVFLGVVPLNLLRFISFFRTAHELDHFGVLLQIKTTSLLYLLGKDNRLHRLLDSLD